MAWREQANFKNVTITGTQSVAGAAAIAGNATVAGTLAVTGATTLTAKLTAAVPIQLPIYTVASLPTGTAGQIAFTTNGAQGSPSLVWHDGTNWIEEDGTAAAAS